MAEQDQNRRGRWRVGLRSVAGAVAVLSAVAGLAIHNHSAIGASGITRASMATVSDTSAPPALTSPLPAARYGRAGKETTVVALVEPPDGQGCRHMHVIGDPITYRLVGDGPWTSTGSPNQRQAQLWWVTGHTLPVEEAADHAPAAPGCDHSPAFYVDGAQTLTEWLSALLHTILMPAPTTPAPTATAVLGHPASSVAGTWSVRRYPWIEYRVVGDSDA